MTKKLHYITMDLETNKVLSHECLKIKSKYMKKIGEMHLKAITPDQIHHHVNASKNKPNRESIFKLFCFLVIGFVIAISPFVLLRNFSIKQTPAIDFNQEHQLSNTEQSCPAQLNFIENQLKEMRRLKLDINAIVSKNEHQLNTLIQNALELYEADGIGLMDYAANYAGGRIVDLSPDTKPYKTDSTFSIFKIINIELTSNPETMLKPSILPGNCFAFEGDHGTIKIRLAKSINIGNVSISHASRVLLDDHKQESAPKEFEVTGFVNIEDKVGVFLGNFIYDLNGRPHQTFAINCELSKNQKFQMVELSILSNYGNEKYTCVYRFRVHEKHLENPPLFMDVNQTIIA